MYVHYYVTLMLEYASLYDFSIRSDLLKISIKMLITNHKI